MQVQQTDIMLEILLKPEMLLRFRQSCLHLFLHSSNDAENNHLQVECISDANRDQ